MTAPASILEITATITERGQTTVPAAIRRMLGLGARDKVVFRGLPDGTVVLEKRVEVEEFDPVLGAFLDFLDRDMAARPHAIKPIDEASVARGRALVEGVHVDLDEALPDDEGE
jgi:antitoxin PrlF